MNIAIYCRISFEDGGKSIENQLELAYKYIEDNEKYMINCEGDIYNKYNIKIKVTEYIDRGKSGSNMERQGIQELIANLNNIDIVLVKDISRLGRNYIEVGSLLNMFFKNNTRLIAINREFDIELNSLLADFYSKDISIKTKSVLDMNKKKGKYSLPKVPFGYRKSKTDKYCIEVYEPEAKYVRFIYRKYEEGYKIREIVCMLNSYEEILEKTCINNEIEDIRKEDIINLNNRWNYHKVYRILHNEFYQGTMVYGKTIGHIWQGNKRKNIDSSEWKRVYYHHDSII